MNFGVRVLGQLRLYLRVGNLGKDIFGGTKLFAFVSLYLNECFNSSHLQPSVRTTRFYIIASIADTQLTPIMERLRDASGFKIQNQNFDPLGPTGYFSLIFSSVLLYQIAFQTCLRDRS